jgi:hypothetical protein
MCNCFQTATVTAANTPGKHINRLSAQTVRNHLREGGLHPTWISTLCCFLKRRLRVNTCNVNWAHTHQRLLSQQLNSVHFSGELRFSIHRADDRVRVYFRRNECYADSCVLEQDRSGGWCSVFVWSGIAHGFRVIEGI